MLDWTIILRESVADVFRRGDFDQTYVLQVGYTSPCKILRLRKKRFQQLHACYFYTIITRLYA